MGRSEQIQTSKGSGYRCACMASSVRLTTGQGSDGACVTAKATLSAGMATSGLTLRSRLTAMIEKGGEPRNVGEDGRVDH